MKRKVIFVNAPPRSGKDVFADEALELFSPNCILMKAADPIVNMVKTLFGSEAEFQTYREELKDKPLFGDERKGTLRELFIAISENAVKPVLGNDFYGRDLARRISGIDREIVVISDIGFDEEAAPVLSDETNQCYLVQIERPGCSFRNDSRNWINPPLSLLPENRRHFIDNFGSLDLFQSTCQNVLAGIQHD
jgi:hypothetical protein